MNEQVASGEVAEAAAKPKTPEKKTPEVVTLKDICKELRVNPAEARAKLRAAGKKIRHAPKSAWQWSKGSPVIKEVKAILKAD
jgi:hypothetical protein